MDEPRSRSKEGFASNDVIDQLNVRYRICDLFVEDTSINQDHVIDNEKKCRCGLRKKKHKISAERSARKWNMRYNTLEKIDSEHGHIGNKSMFMRLAQDTPLAKVEQILLEAWKIPKPRFIVSVVGGAKYFKLSDRLETSFINGIIEIAQKSDAWLLTSGYKVGIVQLVGQAIRKLKLTKQPQKKIIAIGICKWGSIANVERFTKFGGEKEKIIDPPSNGTKKRQKGEWDLEMNHSHYLMLDDGTVRQYETKDYRTKLALHMARLPQEDDIAVPAVTIVVEGGKDTIVNVYYDLKENIPVVLVVGSGRAADFLNRWLLHTKDFEKDTEHREIIFGIDELIEEQSSTTKRSRNKSPSNSPTSNSTTRHLDSQCTRLEMLFEKYTQHLKDDLKDSLSLNEAEEMMNDKSKQKESEKKVHDLTLKVMYCLQPAVRSDLTIFNLNSSTDLSDTIFRSICLSRQRLFKRRGNQQVDAYDSDQQSSDAAHEKQWKKRKSQSRQSVLQKDYNAERSRLLELAMDWNCIDVAREFVFQSSLTNILNKNQLFTKALQQDLPTFVYEFLQCGINLTEVFYPENEPRIKKSQYMVFIKALYTQEAVNDTDKTHLRFFIDAETPTSPRTIDTVEALYILFNTLIGDYMHKLYFNNLDEEDEHRIEHGLMRHPRDLSGEKKKKKELMDDYIMRDLFLWAIVMNRSDMAKVLLSHMKYRICPALIATKIFKQYEKKAIYGDLRKKYQENAKYFEQYAIDCLNQCSEQNMNRACKIVLQRNELYGYVTCLQVASDADDKLFLATSSAVKAVNNVWYDKLHPDQSQIHNHISLLVGFVSAGLLAPIFVTYRKLGKEIKKIDPADRKVRSNGIDYCDPALLEYSIRPPSYPAYKRYFPKLAKFHQSLPMKFCYHLITYIFFLLLFSYVLLFNFEPPTNQIPSIHWTEILTIILVTCMLIEEVYFFFGQVNLTWSGRLKNYFGRLFKQMTFLGLLLFYIGLIIRFTYARSEVDFTVARVIMAFDLEIWWLRSISFIIVLPFLGPHLVSIGKMLKDLLFFMCLIFIVMTGYGVASRSMVYYPTANGFTQASGGLIDNTFDGRSIFRHIAYPVYYLMYGEFGNELQVLDSARDAGWSIATHVILALHMIFVNILLINLLIALFSKRFEKVYEDTKKIWHSQQYLFVREYYKRSPFFPPISLFCDIYYLCRMLFFYIRRQCGKSADYNAKVFQILAVNDSTIEEWREFEESSTYEYAHNQSKSLKTASTKSVATGSDSSNKEYQESLDDDEKDINGTIDGLQQAERELLNMNIIVEAMREEMRTKKNK